MLEELGAGEVQTRLGDFERAAELLSRSLTLAREDGDRALTAKVLHGMGDLALARGQMDAARDAYRAALRIDLEPLTTAYCLGGLAATTAATGDPVRAGRLWGAMEGVEASAGAAVAPDYRRRYELMLGSRLLDPAFIAAREEGRAIALHHAADFALSLD